MSVAFLFLSVLSTRLSPSLSLSPYSPTCIKSPLYCAWASQFAIGDVLALDRGLYKHYAILLPKNTLYHFVATEQNLTIEDGTDWMVGIHKIESYDNVTVRDLVFVDNWKGPGKTMDQILRLAINLDGKYELYSFLDNNCEHKANLLKYGAFVSHQIENLYAVKTAFSRIYMLNNIFDKRLTQKLGPAFKLYKTDKYEKLLNIVNVDRKIRQLLKKSNKNIDTNKPTATNGRPRLESDISNSTMNQRSWRCMAKIGNDKLNNCFYKAEKRWEIQYDKPMTARQECCAVLYYSRCMLNLAHTSCTGKETLAIDKDFIKDLQQSKDIKKKCKAFLKGSRKCH